MCKPHLDRGCPALIERAPAALALDADDGRDGASDEETLTHGRHVYPPRKVVPVRHTHARTHPSHDLSKVMDQRSLETRLLWSYVLR